MHAPTIDGAAPRTAASHRPSHARPAAAAADSGASVEAVRQCVSGGGASVRQRTMYASASAAADSVGFPAAVGVDFHDGNGLRRLAGRGAAILTQPAASCNQPGGLVAQPAAGGRSAATRHGRPRRARHTHEEAPRAESNLAEIINAGKRKREARLQRPSGCGSRRWLRHGERGAERPPPYRTGAAGGGFGRQRRLQGRQRRL